MPVVPALVQLKVKNFAFQKASGVRTDAKVTALINGRMAASDTGELQITNYGISGIPVFQVSRYISRALYEKQNAQVMIDFLPELKETSLRELFSKKLQHLSENQKAKPEDLLTRNSSHKTNSGNTPNLRHPFFCETKYDQRSRPYTTV